VVVEIDTKNGDFGGFVTWPFRQFGNSGVDQEYLRAAHPINLRHATTLLGHTDIGTRPNVIDVVH
jgi:hypothetical protein